ncbi:MAG: hypothetical protein IPL46_28765 [Saprospiraceae bacterium]|nr:hypothetical protein [Saprospiraceae bacterium]
MNLPTWALRKATLSDRENAMHAHKKMAAKIVFSNRAFLVNWMKKWGWRRSWFFPEESFYTRLFENDENYSLALSDQIVEVFIPKESYQITSKQLKEMDDDYASQSWSWVVGALREIRRAIEAGVIIEVDDQKLKSVSGFYKWAHQRYHALEEAADKWVLDDR